MSVCLGFLAAWGCYGPVVVADPVPERPFLGPGASPATIRACLLPQDRDRFSEAYAAASAAGDAAAQHEAIERWRGIALLQADRQRYAETVGRVAQRKTGCPVPDDQPLSITRRAAGM